MNRLRPTTVKDTSFSSHLLLISQVLQAESQRRLVDVLSWQLASSSHSPERVGSALVPYPVGPPCFEEVCDRDWNVNVPIWIIYDDLFIPYLSCDNVVV